MYLITAEVAWSIACEEEHKGEMRVQDELLKQEVNADLRQTRLSTVFDAL